MGLNSCLYEVNLWHQRNKPKHYEFRHKIFMFYLDLDQVCDLSKISSLIGYNQPRVYSFQEDDHILSLGRTCKESVLNYVRQQGLTTPVSKVHLLTNLRTFGYNFNPVSFYYCFDAKDQPLCVVVEIGNTFRELKYFYLGPEKGGRKSFEDHQTKYYYISPFTDLDNQLHFRVQVPDERLNIQIDVTKDGQKFFYSSMAGVKRPLTAWYLIKETLKYPFITFKVIFYIHWHAAILHFIKKVSHHPKEENPQLQKEVWREWTKA